VLLVGCDINGVGYRCDELRQKVGIVFQCPEYQLFAGTVEKDVAFGLKHYGLSSTGVKNRVEWALENAGLNYRRIRGESPLDLFGGEKRKVASAGVLTMDGTVKDVFSAVEHMEALNLDVSLPRRIAHLLGQRERYCGSAGYCPV